MTTLHIDGKLSCIQGHEVSEAPDDPGKWQLVVVAVRASSLRLGYFPVEVRRFILGRGTKEEMEALWDSICKQNTSSEPESEQAKS